MCSEGRDVARVWVQGDLVEAMAEVHFGVAGSSFEEVSDFLYCFYVVGCPFECFVCLSHVNVHSYLLLILFFCDYNI